MRVLVVGAGVVGAACARALADAGAWVRVRDPGAGRAAASWSAAGILSPSSPHRLPEAVHALAARSMELWDGLGARLPAVEMRRVGLTLLGENPEWRAWRGRRGLACTPSMWRPAVGPSLPALSFPEVAVVRANRVATALLGGIAVERVAAPPPGAPPAGFDAVVEATGAWAGPRLAALGADPGIAPRRGQMLLFDAGGLDGVLMDPPHEGVAVPRADGTIVLGTTMEDAGFDATTRDDDLARLEAWGRSRIPRLGRRIDAWAGLRPWSPRPAPTIGAVAPGVVVAAGHFRNGVLLAPATGELVADLVLGRAPRVDPAPYAPGADRAPAGTMGA